MHESLPVASSISARAGWSAGAGLKHIAVFGVAVLALTLGGASAYSQDSGSQQGEPAPLPTQISAPVSAAIPVAYMLDLSTGQTLYSRDPGRLFMPASITKVMTAYTAFRRIAEGDLSTATRITISEQLEEEWSGEGSSMFLLAGQTPSVEDLLMGTTTVSGNDATVALAQVSVGSLDAWLDLMNENARELGMSNSHFGSPNGFPDGGKTYTNAYDLAILGKAITTDYPALYKRFFGHMTLNWNGRTQANHDPVTGRVAGADGIKTGFTSEAGYTFLGTGERDGRRLIMVLAAAPDTPTRDTAARAFLEWGFSSFSKQQILPAGQAVGQARVQNGETDTVMLRTSDTVLASIPKQSQGDVQLSIRYRGPLEAPILAGDPVAKLRVSIAGMAPFDVPLEAAQSVGQAGFFKRLTNGIAGFFT